MLAVQESDYLGALCPLGSLINVLINITKYDL